METKKAAVGFIFVTILLDIIGMGIIIPVMPKLISELIHGNLSDASRWGGWLMFAYSIMQFIFAPIIGNLSDRYGRRPVLLISLFAFGIDYIFLALAPTIGWLFLGRMIAGIAGASYTTGQAYIADVSPPEKRAQNFGMIGAAFGIGFIIGPVLGGILGQYGSRLPFYASAAIALLNWLYGYFILPESLPASNRRKFDWKRANPLGSLKQMSKYPLLIGLGASLLCIYIGAHALQSTWSYFTMEAFQWNEAMIGYSLGFAGIMIAIVQAGLIRIVVPRIGPKRALYAGLILHGIGQLLFALSTEGWMLFAVMVPYCLGGLAGPSIQSIMSAQVKPNEQGELQGAFASMLSLTSIIGPPLMTNLFAHFTKHDASLYLPQAPFIAGVLLAGGSIFFAMKTLKGYVH